MSETAFEFRNVDIVFGQRRQVSAALDLLDKGANRSEILQETGAVAGCAGIDLTIKRGEIAVLMGLSGSGKSTLLRAANRLTEVSRGSIRLHHEGKSIDIVTCSNHDLLNLRRQYVTMVFQQFALLPWRSVAENVAFGLELSGMAPAQRRERVMEQLALVHLDNWADKNVNELSGGMQQRVGLARALATEAPILLMDEPFSALDPLIRAKLQDELLQLQERLHKTILFVSHDLDEALKIGQTISIMEEGRIVQTGMPEDIILHPRNAYVRDFIANVNPLKVLTAWNVMCDVRDLEDAGESWLWLDAHRTARLKLDQSMRVNEIERSGRQATLQPSENLAPATGQENLLYWAQARTPLSQIIECMHNSNAAPVILLNEEQRVIGAIGMENLLRAVVGRVHGT